VLRTFSLRWSLLDRPNERSLHKTPVPRLGGVAIALATWFGLGTVHALQRSMPGKFEIAWLVTSALVAALGLVDDLRPLRASARLLLQVACAALFCLLAGIPRGISLVAPLTIVLPPAISFALWVLFIVAVLNLFNFMDGMDGLAGTQALGAALGIGGAFAVSHQPSLVALCALLAAASAGFLVHNFPPAKIFMGDAGSTFLGFSFAALAVIGADQEPGLPVSTFAFALAPFLLDGTLTLARRAFRLEPIWKAHRTHLYQRAVTAGRSHRDVLVVYAIWIAFGAVAAICAARGGGNTLAILALGALTTLAAVLAWVWRLERAFAQSSPDSRIQATSSATAAVKST
jgi:UDP-N-acetylmuramyl pentapeptide phosphotransferase/UDP-N-acetylglucosamine-1-phosphate transferase